MFPAHYYKQKSYQLAFDMEHNHNSDNQLLALSLVQHTGHAKSVFTEVGTIVKLIQ